MNRNLPQRKNLRLDGYDYSKAGLYYITICVQDRLCLFGEIINHEMILTPAGLMIEKWYWEMENKYPDKKCHEMVVMPNHFHCIIENMPQIIGNGTNTMNAHNKTPNDHTPDVRTPDDHTSDDHVGSPLRGRPDMRGRPNMPGHPIMHNPKCKSPYGPNNTVTHATIGAAMDWFKTMTTNEYIRGVKQHQWQRFNQKLWQRNYYEHIVRNQTDYLRIAQYINQNPNNWNNDTLNKKLQ